jgi:hypothetical protein
MNWESDIRRENRPAQWTLLITQISQAGVAYRTMAALQQEHVLGTGVANHALTLSFILFKAEDALDLVCRSVAECKLSHDLWDAGTIATRTSSLAELDERHFALRLLDGHALHAS